ncbi:MAG: class IV adenylate cyclase [Bacteroidetes bacterium]|nr:class IV adenylate cyclase [Bacteroidota bacterium]
MKFPREVEIKLKVADARSLKKRLNECGFAVVERRHFESNTVFDFCDSRLRRSSSLLRLRTESSRHILTFKGPPRASRTYKIRTELETEVRDVAIQQIFQALGLQPIFRYEKFRTVYAEKHRGKAGTAPLLVYDETPIGHFIELEGSARWIDRVARRLGYLKRDYITASYAALYLDYCKKNRVKPRNMVFAADKS